MSLHVAAWVICDVCYESAGADLSDGTPRAARMAARADGYVRRRKDGMMWDVCPECIDDFDAMPDGET